MQTEINEYISESVEDTERIVAELSSLMKKGDFYAMYGDLGAGKTAFVRGFVGALGGAEKVKSPTYAIVNVYRTEKMTVNHFDMYRIKGEEDLESCGFYDYLESGVTICEWSENIPFALPEEYTRIEITKIPEKENARKIVISKIKC